MDHVVNVPSILSNPMIPAVVKAAAQRLQTDQFFTPGNWLEHLAEIDLQSLMLMAEKMTTDNMSDEAVAIVVLAELLATAEGVDLCTERALHRIQYLVAILACESLARKNVVNFYRDQVSFGSDADTNTIATVKT